MIRRLFSHCLLRPEDIAPSCDEMEVVGTFNPGVAEVNGEVVLLVRVAERPKEQRSGSIALPRFTAGPKIVVDWVPTDAAEVLDPRVVRIRQNGAVRLTFCSHLVVARSANGRSIDRVETSARFFPIAEEEEFGVEDPRITRIGNVYYFTYVAVSRHGAATALASTQDFREFTRHGIIFCVENKDVLLFPETVHGKYAALHRPNPATLFSPPEMWIAYSPDLIDWGRHRPFHGGSGEWDAGRIGGGAPPFKTPRGWVEIYHGNNKVAGQPGIGAYAAGALLLDFEDPSRILQRTRDPFMVPQEDFERAGFVADVVFPTGLVERDDVLQVYYGAADTRTGIAEFSRNELLSAMT